MEASGQCLVVSNSWREGGLNYQVRVWGRAVHDFLLVLHIPLVSGICLSVKYQHVQLQWWSLCVIHVVCSFRLLAKSLAAFLAAQLPSDASLRLSADDPGAISKSSSPPSSPQQPPTSPPMPTASQQARQTFTHLESLRTRKDYASLRDTVDMAVESVVSPQMSLRDAPMFLSRLISALFPNVRYLEIIRRPSLWMT